MKKFVYYSKTDSTREPHGQVQAINETQAIEIAAEMKKLNVDEFLTVFKIKLEMICRMSF
jgi:hypothetical protein